MRSALIVGLLMETILILEPLEMALLKFLYLRQIIHLLPHVTDAARILWTTTLTTPYVVTENSMFQLNMKTTDSVSVDFSNDENDNNIIKMGADPIQLYLTVTE